VWVRPPRGPMAGSLQNSVCLGQALLLGGWRLQGLTRIHL